MAITYELGPSSDTAVTLRVEYSSKFTKRQQRSMHRTLAGDLYIYRWSNYINHSFNVDYMQSSAAAIVNSWWENNTELLLFVTSDSTTEVFSLMITNKDRPMDKYVKPHYTYLKGRIRLESY